MRSFIALALALVLAPSTADAARWQSKRVSIVDYTGWSAVGVAAAAWDAATVVKLSVKVGNPAAAPTDCRPVVGVIAICFADRGVDGPRAVTNRYDDGKTGNIIAASITINTALNPQMYPQDWRVFIVGHELGHAVFGLPHVCRIGSWMSGCQGPGLLPQEPDDLDAAAGNAAYGGK